MLCFKSDLWKREWEGKFHTNINVDTSKSSLFISTNCNFINSIIIEGFDIPFFSFLFFSAIAISCCANIRVVRKQWTLVIRFSMLPINGVPSKHTTDYYYLCGRGIAGAPNTINIPQLRMLYCYYIRYCCWLLACLLLLTLAVGGECEKKPIASKAINGIIIPQTHSIHSDLCDVCVCVCAT